MGKNDEMIMVVERDVLLGYNNEWVKFFQDGFCPQERFDFYPCLKHPVFERRVDVEKEPYFKQPIGYGTIVDFNAKRIFAYQRATDKNYQESRLAGKWSWGFGGHIHIFDLKDKNGKDVDPVTNSLLRELEEETTLIGDGVELKKLGYINDDSNLVGQVHFGILFAIPYQENKQLSVKSEAKIGKWMNYDGLVELCKNPDVEVETWSRIALAPLKEILD